MEPSQFDDFIKSNTQDELPVPAELSWENMNFTLPPAKRKRRIFPWILFLLISTVGVTSGLWYAYQQDNTQSQTLLKMDSVGEQNQKSETSLQKENAGIDMEYIHNAGENTTAGNNDTNQENKKSNTGIKKEIAGIDMKYIHNAGENTVADNYYTNQENQKSETSFEKENAGIVKKYIDDADENTVAGNNYYTSQKIFQSEQPNMGEMEEGIPLYLSQTANLNDNESEKADTPKPSAPLINATSEKISQLEEESLFPFTLLNVLPIRPIRSTSSENQFTFTSSALHDTHTQQLRKSRALLLSIGANKAYMNHSSTSMNDTETPTWGNSYQILLEQEMKDNWLVSIGLGYQRLHTTFYYEKDLGTYVNFSELQVIKQTRRVFHNNYVELVSLNLGGGKEFIISPRWQGQILMYLSPSYRLSYTGRTIDDFGTIIELDPNTVAQNKWIWNADAALRFSYNLNKTDLIIGANLSQSLTKSDLLSGSNYMTTVQPRVFGLNLGIKRIL